MLCVEGLTISYDGTPVIQDAAFTLGEGITVITGKSGSGKSSLLNALTGQIPAFMTRFTYGDEDLQSYPSHEFNQFVRSNITYLVQGDNFISDLTCFENISLFAKMAGKTIQTNEIEALLQEVGLDLTAAIYPDRLSGGEKQRLALVQALAKDTPIILCDEITASLDEKNKNEMMSILKMLASKYHKIIVMTSHDEAIYEQSDHLYEIRDGRLFEKTTSDVISLNQINPNPPALTLGDFKHYVSAKIERQFGMFILFAFMCGLVISLGTYITYYRYSFVTMQKDIMDVLSPKEINIINQTVPNMYVQTSSFMYDKENKPFLEEEIDQILNTPHIAKAYPYYQCASTNHPLDGMYIEKLTLGSQTYEYVGEEAFNVFPYNPQQHFDEVHHVLSEDALSGAYINEMFIMNVLHMTKDEFMALEDKTITFDCYIPVANTQTESYAVFDEADDEIAFISYSPVYQSKKMTIEIVGIIDPWYQETMSYQNIYIPIDRLEELRKEVSADYIYKEGETPWNYNAYRVYVDDVKYMEETNVALQKISGIVSTGSSYMDYNRRFESLAYIKGVSLVALVIVLGTGCVLAYAYGIYYYQKNSKDLLYFKRNGLTKLEFKRLIGCDIITQLVVVYLMGVVLSVGIFNLAMKRGMHTAFGWLSMKGFVLAAVLFGYGFLLMIMTRLYFNQKVKKNVE